jgi:hypothetical protein
VDDEKLINDLKKFGIQVEEMTQKHA